MQENNEILEFKKTPNVVFEVFLKNMADNNIRGALTMLNSLYREFPDLTLCQYRALLFSKMPGTENEQLNLYLNLLVSNSYELLLAGGSYFVTFLLNKKEYKLAKQFLDFTKHGLKGNKNCPKEVIDGIAEFEKKILFSGFSIVDEETKIKEIVSRAKKYILDEDYDDAIHILDNCIFESDEIQFLLASCFCLMGNLDKCIEICNKKAENIKFLFLKQYAEFCKKEKYMLFNNDLRLECALNSYEDKYFCHNLCIFDTKNYTILIKIQQKTGIVKKYSPILLKNIAIAKVVEGKISDAKYLFEESFAISEYCILSKEINLILDAQKTLKLNFLDIFEQIKKKLQKSIKKFLGLGMEELVLLKRQNMINLLNWVDQFEDEETLDLILEKLLSFPLGQMVVRESLFSFFASKKFKLLAIENFAKIGSKEINLWVLSQKFPKFVTILQPKNYMLEFSNYSDFDSKAPILNKMLFESYTRAVAILSISELENFEIRLKTVAETFMALLQNYPSNLKKMITVDNLLCAMIFCTCSEKYFFDEDSKPIFHPVLSNLTLLARRLDCDKLCIEKLLQNLS